jgi:hypothetical protein
VAGVETGSVVDVDDPGAGEDVEVEQYEGGCSKLHTACWRLVTYPRAAL